MPFSTQLESVLRVMFYRRGCCSVSKFVGNYDDGWEEGEVWDAFNYLDYVGLITGNEWRDKGALFYLTPKGYYSALALLEEGE